MHEKQVELPDLGLMGTHVGPRLRALRDPRRHDRRPRRQHHRPERVPADRPRGRASRSRCSPTAATPCSLYRRPRRPRPRASSPASGCPPCRHPRPSRQRIDADRYLGTYSREVADLVVTQDDDGRIWLDMTPKGIAVEMGDTAERTELVHYRDDTLIPLARRPGHAPAVTRSSATTAQAARRTCTWVAPSSAPATDLRRPAASISSGLARHGGRGRPDPGGHGVRRFP